MPTLREQYEADLRLPQIRATLDTIAWAEGGRSYGTLYGGGTFSDFSKHPNRRITAGGYTSTAAGRYQFLYSTYVDHSRTLGITDFSPHSQDLLALREADVKGGLPYFRRGDFVGGLKALGANGRCAWAALPYAGCNQKMRGINETVNYYNSKLNGNNIVPGQTQNQISPGMIAVGFLVFILLID